MSQAILCPQCEKRYSLPDRPPATFTCKQCGALVDLTAFGGGAAPPPTPASPKPGAGPSRSGRRQRSRAPARQPRDPQKQASKAPIVGIITVVLIVIVLIATRSGGDDTPKTRRNAGSEDRKSAGLESKPIDPNAYRGPDAGEQPEQPKPKRPKLREDGSLKLRLGRIDLKVHEWPEEIDEATRPMVETALAAMYAGGADGLKAREYLVNLGRPVAGRLISEFYTIRETPGWDNRDGTSMAMQIDDLLRELDGFMERICKEREQIRSTGVFAGQSFMTRIAKRWTWWWESGEWQTNPQKPWDPFEDETDDTATGMKPVETTKDPKKGPKKGRGFEKRAGSG